MKNAQHLIPQDTKALAAPDLREVAELVLWLAGMVGAMLAIGWPI